MAKAANDSGSVYYDAARGKHVAALSYKDEQGKRKRRVSRHDSREEADDALAQMKAERAKAPGRRVKAPKRAPTLTEHLVSWLRVSIAPNVSPRTLEGYEIAARVHVLPALGSKRLDRITMRDIETLYAAKRAEGYSVATRRKIHNTLKRSLRQAVLWGEIAASPAEFVDPPKAPPQDEEDAEEVSAFSEEELARLFAAAEEREDRLRNLYVVAARTGLRQGELLALRWSDLDLASDPASLMVRRSLAPKIGGAGGGYYFTPLKKKRQRRRVALHHEAASALTRQRELQEGEVRAAGSRWGADGLGGSLVFPSTLGTPMNAANVRNRHYYPVLAEASLPRLNFHALRHTFASIALFDWRMNIKMVAELLGHSNVTLTWDTYSHLAEGSHETEMKRINALFSNPGARRITG